MTRAFTIAFILLLFVLSFFHLTTSAQNSVDSLKALIRKDKDDTNKVNHLNKLARELLYSNTDSTILLTTQALQLAEKENWKKGFADSYFLLGATKYLSGDNSNAIEYANKALSIYEALGDKSGIVKIASILGVIYQGQGEYTKALDYDLRALAIDEELGDKRGIAIDYENIGIVYIAQGDYPKALDNLFKALKLAEEVSNKEVISNSLIAIGKVYNDQANYAKALDYYFKALKISNETGDKYRTSTVLGNIGLIYSNKHDYENALDFYFRALKITQDIGDKNSTSRHLGNIGELYYDQGNYSKALSYYSDALKMTRELGDKYSFSFWQGSIGKVYIKMGKFKEAEMELKKAIALADSIKADDNVRKLEEALTQLYDTTGNYKQALLHLKKVMILKDTIFNQEKNKEITRKEMNYEFDKKEAAAKAEQDKKDARAKRLKIQQYFIMAGLGIIVLTVLLIALIQYRNNKQKQKANLLLQQQKEKVETTLSELKTTQAQLIQSEKMASLGELTAGIAHEIQNPLNFVNNFSEVNNELIDEAESEIEKGNINEAKTTLNYIKENQQKINHHGKRADAIVKGMLQHSRSSSGVKEPTDINALADEYLRLSYHGLRAKDKSFNATMKTDFDKSIGSINIIPQDIGRVILNLVNNAFYAVDEKKKSAVEGYEPTVTVITKKAHGKVEIRVVDNGNGVPQKVLDKIFQPFFTTKPTGVGTGLGLSLSYDIVKAHGGEIKVETKGGEGTKFIIQLPI